MVDVFRELSELLGGGETPRHRAVPFHRDGQVARRFERAVLHRLQDRRVLEHHAAAAQLLFECFFNLFGLRIARAAQHRLARGRVENARGNDLVSAEKHLSLFFKCKEVEQHLEPQPVAQLGEVEALLARLVVHDAQI